MIVADAVHHAVLIGLENSGKSAVFRALSGNRVGDETNFRGSTIQCRRGYVDGTPYHVVDTPGIRLRDDSETTRLALSAAATADTMVLVIRADDARRAFSTIVDELGASLSARPVVIVVTFKDKMPNGFADTVAAYERALGVPIALVNARSMGPAERDDLLGKLQRARPLTVLKLPQDVPSEPRIATTVFEHPQAGPIVSLGLIFALFGVPIVLAYLFAQAAAPVVDAVAIEPLARAIGGALGSSGLLHDVLVGRYGLLTLGWYSFLWAFPVVLLIGFSVALADETGIKDRITSSLDPWLRAIGLSGRDLIPVLSGFGCNVVAVLQTRACSTCTRRNCVSLIAFGSACSYQIGASLSLFGSAGRPGLFVPYIALVFFVGAIHTRLWGRKAGRFPQTLARPAFLQAPNAAAVMWRVRAVLKQFLFQAMPVFLVICLAGSLAQYVHVTDVLIGMASSVLRFVGLPPGVAPGVVFSLIRKDGLLVLNEGNGQLIRQLSAGQLFVLVYLASTFSACLVTLWTVGRELGPKYALAIAGKQALSSTVSTFAIALVLRLV